MGDNCSTCCSTNDDVVYSNMYDSGVMNERWVQAVRDNSIVGCRYVHMDDPDVIDQVVDAATGERAIHVAVRNRNVQLIEYLGQNNVDIDCQSRDKAETGLHIAARHNDVQSIKLLLSFGADPDIRNKDKKLARDLCAQNLRREFNKAKVQKLRRLGPPKPEKTSSKNDILIGGQSISTVNLKTLRTINKSVDTETEGAKRARLKKEEIQRRGENFITVFGVKVGCEVDELALLLEKMDIEARKELWTKIMRNIKYTDKQTDVKKLMLALAYSVTRKRAAERTKSKNPNRTRTIPKPDGRQIERLVSVLRRKFPRERNKKILKRHDFVQHLHVWLYEIHESDEWQNNLI